MPLVTTNQAVKDLFGIEGSEPLRSKANSYLRNGVIPSSLVVDDGFSDESMGKRGKKLLKSQAVNCLFNALVLDAFFNDTKLIKAIFEQSRTRVANVVLCEEVLLKAQEVTTVIHLSDLAQQFLSQLKDESFNLREHRLTCPFNEQRLPQMDMAQRLSLSHKEQIWLCWLEQDLAAASQLADQVDSALLEKDIALKEMVKRVRKEYQEAQSFNALLSFLPD